MASSRSTNAVSYTHLDVYKRQVLKRTIGGTYTHVNPRHLDRYLAEQVYRFNEREERDGYRFAKVTKKADGKRLTWKALTVK